MSVHWVDRPTRYRYFQNGFDVTWYVMNDMVLPTPERFWEVEVKDTGYKKNESI